MATSGRFCMLLAADARPGQWAKISNDKRTASGSDSGRAHSLFLCSPVEQQLLDDLRVVNPALL